MSLPGLPPPQRAELPMPPGGAAAARRRGRQRQTRALGSAMLVIGTVAAALALIGGDRPTDRLQGQLATPGEGVAADEMGGSVVDSRGQPVAGIAVLDDGLTQVLTRTAPDGTWTVPCIGPVVLAPYAPTTKNGPVRERSPGAGNYGWRRVPERCGERVELVLREGAVLRGEGRPGEDVRVERVQGQTRNVLPQGPVFVTRVREDATWAIEGLDTGRYRLPSGTVVDLREGQSVLVTRDGD